MKTTERIPLPGFKSEIRDVRGARLHTWTGGGTGREVGTMVNLVAENVEAVTLEHCGHFVPEESPDDIVERVLKLGHRTA